MSNTLNVYDAIACIRITENSSTDERNTAPVDETPVLTPLGAGLAIAYLVHAGDALVSVQERHLVQLDGRRDRLARIGLRNLMTLAGERMEVRTYNNIYAVFLDGHFEASLTLLNTLWDETLAGMVPNGPVMAMPAHDVLAFCDAESPAGIRELREMVDRLWTEGPPAHAISRDLFHRRDQRWRRMMT